MVLSVPVEVGLLAVVAGMVQHSGLCVVRRSSPVQRTETAWVMTAEGNNSFSWCRQAQPGGGYAALLSACMEP